MPVFFFGCVLALLGLIFYVLCRQQRQKLFNAQSARKTTVQELQGTAQAIDEAIGGGDWRDYVKLWGEVLIEEPLMSEIQAEPCVHYQTVVTQEHETTTYKRDEKTGQRTEETQRGSETLVNHTRSIPFWLQDSTGKIEVDATGGQIETVEVVNQFNPVSGNARKIEIGPFSFDIPKQTAGRQILGYRYRESILPVGRQVLILGTVSDQGGKLTIRKPTQSGQSLVISLKSDEVYASEVSNSARTFQYLAIGSWVGAVLLMIIGLLT